MDGEVLCDRSIQVDAHDRLHIRLTNEAAHTCNVLSRTSVLVSLTQPPRLYFLFNGQRVGVGGVGVGVSV